MTGLDDQALVLCAKAEAEGQPLPTEARIEIYASQVLLFGQEFGSDTLSEVLTQLLSAAAEEQGETTHTALAALVFLLSEGFSVDHSRIVRTALRNAKCQEHSANLDVQMALSNLIWNQKLDGREFPSAQRLLTSSGTTIAERYDRLYLELASLDGDPHSTPLKRFQQASRNVAECPRRLEHALHSLDQHEDLLRHIDVAWARSPKPQDASSAADGSRTKKEIATQALAQAKATLDMDSPIAMHREPGFLQAREQMLDDIVKTHKTLESYQCQDLTGNPAAENAHSKVIASVKNVRDGMTKLAWRFLFLHMSRTKLFSNEDHPLENCLTEMFKRPDFRALFEAKGIDERMLTFEISMNSDIQIAERIHSVDLVWDQHVEDAIEHFMSNTIYALRERIPDQWQRRPDETHDLWASITYGENAAEIHLCNACNKAAKTVEIELLKKRGRWHRIEEVGGTVYFGKHQVVPDTFQVSLSIPYAGYCRSLRTARRR